MFLLLPAEGIPITLSSKTAKVKLPVLSGLAAPSPRAFASGLDQMALSGTETPLRTGLRTAD